MKKLSFLFAMIFAVSMAMAQTTTITQSNTNAGEAGDNVADVVQTGQNMVKINQVQAITGYPGGTGLVKAEVEQAGAKDNRVIINQTHDGGKNNGVNPLTVYAKQFGGNDNLIKQTQHAGGGNWGNVDFSATQNGSKNTAVQMSVSQAGNDDGVITQKGVSNSATQKWYGTNYRDGNPAGDLFINQDGNRNVANQEFLDGTVFTSGQFNRGVAEVIQKGNDNLVNQSQKGAGNEQYLLQKGNQNTANMIAEGNYNVGDVKQTGVWGTVKLVQKQDELGEAGEGVENEGNVAWVSQDGNGSKATIMQDGLSNLVTGLSGAGYAVNNNGAMLKVTQTGENNQVWSRQLVGASETVTQTGMNNAAIVNQY